LIRRLKEFKAVQAELVEFCLSINPACTDGIMAARRANDAGKLMLSALDKYQRALRQFSHFIIHGTFLDGI
jgi:hypothetical protein